MRPLAIALGDPAGIGPEIVAKAWEARSTGGLPPFFAVGDPRSLTQVWGGPVARIADPAEAMAAWHEALPIIPLHDAGPIQPGHPDLAGARCSLESLELAAGLARAGNAGAVITAPVSKSQLYAIGFVHPGQTEYIAELCGIARDNTAMMLAGPSLRVVPVTTHVPLGRVPDLLTADLILAKARATVRGLQKSFGIATPRIAIAGLNPHAGEGGGMGREEIDVIMPAIAVLRGEGIEATGPHPPDTMFHQAARTNYDAALCMYHDQALIPLKTLHFDEGVNMTLGLPIVRTAPDHGTAFDIAGRGMAHPGAMIAAISMAADAASRRTFAH